MGLKIVEMLFALLIMVVIFGSIFGFPYLMARAKERERDRNAVDQGLRDEMSSRLADLEERVRVLERIVTDERTELRRQFKEL